MIEHEALHRLLRSVVSADRLIEHPDRMTGELGPTFAYYHELDPTDRATLHRIAAGEQWEPIERGSSKVRAS